MDRRQLKRSTLAFRHLLEGYRGDDGAWIPGDLELGLRGCGLFRDRAWLDPSRLPHLDEEGIALCADLEAAIRSLIPSLPERDRRSPVETLHNPTALYLSESACTWFNRLLALRRLEVRVPGVDQAIKVKPDSA